MDLENVRPDLSFINTLPPLRPLQGGFAPAPGKTTLLILTMP